MSSIQALIARKKKDIEAKRASNLKTHKPSQGKNTYRILPAWREPNEFEIENDLPAPFWHDFSLHWIKPVKGEKAEAVYVCTEKTFGTECEICEQLSSVYAASHDEEYRKFLKESMSKQSYLLNALHRSGEAPDEPVILEVGTVIFEQICELIGEYEDITDLEDGIDIVISRSGTGFDTKYTVLPARKSNPVNKAILEKLHDLDAVVAQENATKKAAALKAVGKVAGVLPPSTSSAQSNTALLNDASISDAEFEEMEDDLDEVMSMASSDDLSEDEIDDLLGDVG